jgi:hypothetical protein
MNQPDAARLAGFFHARNFTEQTAGAAAIAMFRRLIQGNRRAEKVVASGDPLPSGYQVFLRMTCGQAQQPEEAQNKILNHGAYPSALYQRKPPKDSRP